MTIEMNQKLTKPSQIKLEASSSVRFSLADNHLPKQSTQCDRATSKYLSDEEFLL